MDGGSTLDGWIGQGTADFFKNSGTQPGTSPRQQGFLKKTGAPGKIIQATFFNANDSLAMQGQGVQMGLDIRSQDSVGAAIPFKAAILRVSGGVLNNVPRPLVSSFNGDGVDPTFNAGISVVSQIGPGSSGGGGAFTTGVVAATLPSIPSTDLFGFAVWTDSASDVGGDLGLSDFSVMPSGSTFQRPNQPPQAQQEVLCKQQVESSYDSSTDPGSVGAGAGQIVGQAGVPTPVMYQTEKLFDPVAGPGSNPSNGITLFSPVTGAVGMWHNVTAGADVPVVPSNSSTRGFEVVAPGAPGDVIVGHYLANAAL